MIERFKLSQIQERQSLSTTPDCFNGPEWAQWDKCELTWGNDEYTITKGKFSIRSCHLSKGTIYYQDQLLPINKVTTRQARKIVEKIAKYTGWE